MHDWCVRRGRSGSGGAVQSIGDQRDQPAAALTDVALDTPRHKPHHEHQERAVDDEMGTLDGAAAQGRAGELADRDQDACPEQRSEDAAEPAEHRHDDHLYRQIEAHCARRRDEQHHLGVEGAGDGCEEGRDQERDELGPSRVDPEALDRVLIVADRREIVAEPGVLDREGDRQRHQQQPIDHVCVAFLVPELQRPETVAHRRDDEPSRPVDKDAEYAIRQFSADAEHLGKCDRREREEGAAQAEARIADHRTCQRRHNAPDDHPEPRREAEVQVESASRCRRRSRGRPHGRRSTARRSPR